MGKVIYLQDILHRSPNDPDSSGPWEFRKADWKTPHFIQVLLSRAHRLERQQDGPDTPSPSFPLEGGRAHTILSMYANRRDEKRMREVYYLIGLMDCMINQVNPILRTDLLRAMYNKVFIMKDDLNIHWHGTLDQVLLPIDPQFYNGLAYRSSLREAETMKGLYQAIRKGTEKMFDILSREYVFYSPWMGG